MTLLESFDPVIDGNCRVLILGSMPGAASLQQQQYYAHPRNAFWLIMQELLGIQRGGKYSERCQMLNACGVGVWDVLKECRRPGSLDSNIEEKSQQPNELTSLFLEYRGIRAVFFNGAAAERLYRKHVISSVEKFRGDMFYQRLPSTSPAFAAMSFEEKRDRWGKALAQAGIKILAM